MLRTLFAILLVESLIVGCASESALVVGENRPALDDHTTIKILTEMPDGAEEIAILKASSDSRFTLRGSLDYAAEEQKKQAAKLGSNAVVITGGETASDVVGVPTYGGGTVIGTSETEIVQGIAVWIEL